ncbi:MAG: GNAT family N-acetyltransferase, partial [Fusobacteriaceae bacterium]|nr:GNAT family N-acetyltransferase [Fusobacteriaceae bacterium]
MKPNGTLTIRYGTDDDRLSARKIYDEVFNDSELYTNYYFENVFDIENFLILEEYYNNSPRIVATLHENPHTVIINEEKFAASFLFAVAVNMEDRGKGYMNDLVRYAIKNSKKTKLDIIFLIPINSKIYKKYGFAYVANLEKYNIFIDNLINFDTNLDFKKLEMTRKEKKEREEKEEREENFNKIEIKRVDENSEVQFYNDLVKIYKEKMKKFNLYFERDENSFIRLIKGLKTESGRCYLLYRDNKAQGYFTFVIEGNKIKILELFLLDVYLYSQVFKMIYSQKEYYREVEILSHEKSNINFYFNNKLDIKKEMMPIFMARILNIREILKNVIADSFIGDVKLRIIDNIIEMNSGVYHVKNKNNVVFTEDNGYFIRDHAEISIEDFAHMLFGYFDIDEMIALNKIKIN